MSREGGKPGKGGTTGRHVTPDEAELWSRTTVSVEKVKVKPRVTAHAREPSPAPPRPASPEPAGGTKRPTAPPPRARVPPRPAATRPQPAAPPATEFDRRSFRKISSGKVAIDATLDLHGLQRDDAHACLRAFLRNSQAQGHRLVLVITGKGGETEDGDRFSRTLGRPERGILRRKVPQWLEEAELRGLVHSYTAAGQRHGGSGALYVQLRKARDT
jgi:DNA-nicking Smr family endonuclease